MLHEAIYDYEGPVAVRYPRGGDGSYQDDTKNPIYKKGTSFTVVTYGTIFNEVWKAVGALQSMGYAPEVLKLPCISPLPMDMILSSAQKTGKLFLVEECSQTGCVAQEVMAAVKDTAVLCRCRNLGNRFLTHGSLSQLYRMAGLDGDSLTQWILEAVRHGQ